jgi:hypothetical protein
VPVEFFKKLYGFVIVERIFCASTAQVGQGIWRMFRLWFLSPICISVVNHIAKANHANEEGEYAY